MNAAISASGKIINHKPRKKIDRVFGFAVLLLAPLTLYLASIMIFPVVWAFYLTFTSSSGGSAPVWVGFKNYADILRDAGFWNSIVATLIFTFFSVLGKVLVGIVWAVVLNQPMQFRNIKRSLLILPWALPTVISILTWRWLYSDSGGVLSYLCKLAGISDKNILWLASGSLSMFSVIVVNIWRGVPFIGISVLSGLQTVPKELYEAAIIDGANSLQRFRSITIPHVKDVIFLSTLITTIWTINDFEIVWLLTRGGPAFATEIISVYSYRVGFLNLNVPKAVAVSFLFLPLLLVLVNLATKKTLAQDK